MNKNNPPKGRSVFTGHRDCPSYHSTTTETVAFRRREHSLFLDELKMPKEKSSKKGAQLRHAPLGNDVEKPMGKLKAPKGDDDEEAEDGDLDDQLELPKGLGAKIFNQAREQRMEISENMKASEDERRFKKKETFDKDQDSDEYSEAESEDDADENYGDADKQDMVEFEGDYVNGAGLSADEEAVVERFLHAGRAETRTLADIIMEKIKEKEENALLAAETSSVAPAELMIPPKVLEVYNSVGKMLAHYKAGKLPKALKMLPHLKNWEDVLWITRPDEWSPSATYACTRIFASNLNEKMAQRFFNLVLLEKCRDDIRRNNKLNYHYYMALKKALFKPAAFYKGLLLPLAQSRTCTLREATIIGSVLAKVSIPGNHSAAALLRLAEMPYSGSTSLFVRVIVNKKYALPRRVVDALVVHFCAFEKEAVLLPVIWHQALLAFAQRYKFEFDDQQRDRLRQLVKIQQHHQITIEVKRELIAALASSKKNAADDGMSVVTNK